MKKVFAVAKSYVNATMLSRLVPWTQMGLSLTLEYTPVSAADKIATVRPDLLIIPQELLHVNVEALIQAAQKANPAVRVIHIREGAGTTAERREGAPAVWYIDRLNAETLGQALREACDVCSPVTAAEDAETAFALPDDSPAFSAKSLRILRFLGGFPGGEAAGAKLRRIFGDNCLSYRRNENGRLSVLFNDSEMEEARALLSSAHRFYELLGTAAESLSLPGQPVSVLVSQSITMEQIREEGRRLDELEAYLYFGSGTQILSRSLVESRRQPFDYALAGKKLNLLFASVVSGDPIQTARIVEELYLKLALASMSFDGLDFCRMRLREQYQMAARIFCQRQEETEEGYGGEAFSSLQEESDHISARFAALADHFSLGRVHAKVVQSLLIVGDRYADIVSLSDIARELSITGTYLSRVFKEDIGVCFVDYLNRIRIFKAREMIVTGEENVGRLSQRVGFVDAKYFTRVFKRYTGLTPSQCIALYAGQNKEGTL